MEIKVKEVNNGWILFYEEEIDGGHKIVVETVFEDMGNPSDTFKQMLYFITELIGPTEARDGFGKENIYITIGPGDEVETDWTPPEDYSKS